MRRVLILSALLISAGALAQTGYHHQISGSVHDAHFNFTHVSDWKDHQIENYNYGKEGESLNTREGGERTSTRILSISKTVVTGHVARVSYVPNLDCPDSNCSDPLYERLPEVIPCPMGC